MAIHPQVKEVLDLRAVGQPATPPVTVEESRATFNKIWREKGPEVFGVEDRNIPGPAGEIPVRIYWPSAGGPFPVLMEFHGGGFVRGNRDSYDGNCRRLCIGAGCVVVNVEYRVSPENKFPAAPEDCYAATNWVAENASSMNVDPTKMAVGGDSAGGNLSAVVCLMARDRGGPTIVQQLIICPAVHRRFTPLTYDRGQTPGGKSDLPPMDASWRHYLRDEADETNPYACPVHADLRGLPPALVITAEYDTLRDEGEAFAEKLRKAGVPTVSKRYEGMIHVFHLYPDSIDGGSEALQQEIDILKVAFARRPPSEACRD